MARLRAFALPAALLALGACGDGGREDPSTGFSSASASAGGTSTGTDSTGNTTETSTGPAPTTGASSGELTTGDLTTGELTDTSTSGVMPPPSCDPPMTQCGVQCVDLDSDPANCGDCGITCVIPHAVAACAAGQCALSVCDDGWFDCDEEVVSGCEQQLAPGQMCGLVCKPNKAETCNVFDDNCDGTCDEGALPGCRVGVHRSSSPTLGHFYTVDAAEAMSGDFTPEALNFFYLYVGGGQGTVPFYRCLKPNGRRFYTTSGTCENGGQSEGSLGHIATDPICGATPLFRLYANGNHFYTVSEAERDNAVATYGYKYEAVAGYVWLGP